MKKSILINTIPMMISGGFTNQKNSDILFSSDIGSHFKNRHSSNICFVEGDGNGDGDNNGGQGNDINFDDPKIKDYVQQQIDAAVTGLKNKNNELLGKNNSLNTKLSEFGDFSPEQVQQLQTIINGNEEAKLIADGKFEEVIAKRMDRTKAEYEEKITGLSSDLEKASGESGKFKKLYEERILGDELRKLAISEGVRPEAYDDILRRGFDIFSLAEDGTIEARDKDGHLVKDAKEMLLTPERFLNGLKETAPYYWPESQGAGADGQGRKQHQQNAGDVGKLADVVGKDGKFDLEAYRAARGKDSSRYQR